MYKGNPLIFLWSGESTVLYSPRLLGRDFWQWSKPHLTTLLIFIDCCIRAWCLTTCNVMPSPGWWTRSDWTRARWTTSVPAPSFRSHFHTVMCIGTVRRPWFTSFFPPLPKKKVLCVLIQNLCYNWVQFPLYNSVADPGCLSRNRIFSISHLNFFRPGSVVRIKNCKKSILSQKIVSKLSEIWSGPFILAPNPDFFYPSWIQGVKKTPDPDPQHWFTISNTAWSLKKISLRCRIYATLPNFDTRKDLNLNSFILSLPLHNVLSW